MLVGAVVVPTTNKHLIRWVEKMAELCQPTNTNVHWLDGSEVPQVIPLNWDVSHGPTPSKAHIHFKGLAH